MKAFAIAIGVGLIIVIGGVLGVTLLTSTDGLDAAELEDAYLTSADRFISVDGARVRIREEGARGEPPVVLLHGFTSSLETWDAVAARLSEDYRVIRFDLLGHGLTGPDPQKRYAMDERAAFLGRVMDALGLNATRLAGHSMGGIVAWRFAAANPQRVQALTLIASPAYPFSGVDAEPTPPNAFLTRFFLNPTGPAFSASLAAMYGDPDATPDGVVQRLQDLMRREGAGQAFVDSFSEFAMPDPDAQLRAITAPTLIIWGGEDRLVSSADQLPGYRDAVENLTVQQIAGGAHMVHEEQPDIVAAAMAAHFETAMIEAQVPTE